MNEIANTNKVHSFRQLFNTFQSSLPFLPISSQLFKEKKSETETTAVYFELII